MISRQFCATIGAILALSVSGASAQDWQFASSDDMSGRVRAAGVDGGEVALTCTRSATSETFEMRIVSATLAAQSGATPGEMATLSIDLDGDRVGRVQFLHLDGGVFAANVPRRHAFVDSLREAGRLDVSADDTAEVSVSLDGLSAALDDLAAFCSGTDEAPRQDVAEAAGTDCSEAATDTERAICADPDLAALDRELAAAVAAQRDALTVPSAREAFVADHEAWLRLRNTCGSDVECLTSAIGGRIARLAPERATQAPAQQAELPQASPPPAPLPVEAVQSALVDQNDIARRMTVEAVRQRPELLENQQLLERWYRQELSQARQGAPTDLALSRDHLARTVAATPTGEFLVARMTGNPLANGTVRQDGLAAPSGRTSQDHSGDLGRIQVPNMYLGAHTEIRARSHYDASFLPATPAQAQTILDMAQQLSLAAVVAVTDVSVLGSPDGGLQVIASGEVRHVGLYRRPQAQQPPLSPPLLAALYAPLAPETPEPGLETMARRLGLTLHDGAMLDGQAVSNDMGRVQTLMRLIAVKRAAPETLSDPFRAFAFYNLATRIEQDDTIPPVHFDAHRTQSTLRFDQTVDEFERAELIDRLDSMLWPRLSRLLPDLPIEGIAITTATLGEYDHDSGGFPIHASVSGMGLMAAGEYPALKSLPDFLPVPVETARQIVAYLESIGGPGWRQVQIVGRYRVTDVGAADWDDRRLPSLTVEALSLSMHGARSFEPGDDPFAQKMTDFDLARYRGDPRPVADAERVAFWAEVEGWTRATDDAVARAAVATADDPQMLGRLAERTSLVAQADEFARDAALARASESITAIPTPEAIVLDGYVLLGEYDPAAGSFPIQSVEFSIPRGELGIGGVSIKLVDPAVLSRLPADVETAQRMMATEDAYDRGQHEMTAHLTPVLAVQERYGETLYVRPTRIVVRALSEDGTGYPAAYVELRPDPAPAAGAPSADGDEAAPTVEAPEALPLDAEYLDLLMVRELGDDISETTFERMMLDRRVREIVAAGQQQEPAWGRFFADPSAAMNPVQERAARDRFIAWTRARAEMLPEDVYVETAAGNLPTQFFCTLLGEPPQGQYDSYVPPDMSARLSEVGYDRLAQLRTTFVRSKAQASAYRLPSYHLAIYGRPSLRGSDVRTDSRQSSCASSVRLSPRADLGGRHWDALITVEGAYRTPQRSGESAILRDFGTIEIDGPTDRGFLDIKLSVTRTEVVAVTQGQAGATLSVVETLDEGRLSELLPPPPLVTDIFGISPGQPWEEAQAAARARLPDALVAVEDGPPASYREATSNTLLGPQPQFQAFRNGAVFIDTGRREGLALLREATRDPERVLAVGSYRMFDAGQTGQEALVGALLRKYGSAPVTASDQSAGGPRPGQILVWGERAGCLPQMRGQVNTDALSRDAIPDIQQVYQITQGFHAPQMTYEGGASIILEGCPTIVWASVAEDREGRIHMIVWSLDLALLDEVARMDDRTVKVDGEDGSKALIDQAADIDL